MLTYAALSCFISHYTLFITLLFAVNMCSTFSRLAYMSVYVSVYVSVFVSMSTALHIAIQNGHLSVTRKLLCDCDVNCEVSNLRYWETLCSFCTSAVVHSVHQHYACIQCYLLGHVRCVIGLPLLGCGQWLASNRHTILLVPVQGK